MRATWRIAVSVTSLLLCVLFGSVSPVFANDAAPGRPSLAIATAKSGYATGEELALTFTVSNTSTDGCQLAAFAAGTVQVTSLTRDGTPVTPSMTSTYYYDGYGSALRRQLRTVAPGQSVSFPPMLIGTAVAVVAPVQADDALTGLWSFAEPGRYVLSASYAVPQVTTTPAVCAGLTPVATVEFTVGGSGGAPDLPMIVIAVVAGVVLVLFVLVWVFTRRRRPPASAAAGPAGSAGSAGAAVTLMLVAGLGVVAVWGARPAQAAWDVFRPADAKFEKAVTDCFAVFAQPGHDPAGIMKDIRDPNKPKVTIRPIDNAGPSTTGTPLSPDGPGSSTILWNKDANWSHVDDGDIDACTELYHELFHAWEFMNKKDSNEECDDTGIPKDEVEAADAENKYRKAVNKKLRTTYNGKTLPKSLDECKKPPTPKKGPQPLCRAYGGGSACGGSNGDPHMTTFKQRHYDLQAVGELVAVRSTTGDLEIQVRQAALFGSRTVSLNSAIAVRVGTDRVGFYLVDGVIVVRRDGKDLTLTVGENSLPAGAKLVRRGSSELTDGDAYTLIWPDGSTAWVDPIGTWGLRLLVSLSATHKGKVSGLFGSFDDNPATTLSTRDGKALPEAPDFDQLYHAFGDSWRVSAEESLFDYGTGQTTQTFTDRTFPDRAVSAADLPEAARTSAEAICRLAGVSDPALLSDCVLDVGLTGAPVFAVNSGTTQYALTVGANLSLAASKPGEPAVAKFPGGAGQKVFVEILSSTLPDACGVLTLRDPVGKVLGSACIISGTGYLDTTELPVTGTYSLVLDPGPGRTGSAELRLTTVVDENSTIAVDGPPVTARIATPGGAATLAFNGTSGQKVFVSISGATVADACGLVWLRAPNGTVLSTGCAIAGTGFVDATVLPANGGYAVVVNPPAAVTGELVLRLTSATDQHAGIAIDAPAVIATVAQPGAVSVLTFTGTAGRKVFVQATAATLADACGVLLLRSPDSQVLASGCVIGGNGLIDAHVLPVTGEYALVVDPAAAGLGQVSLRLTSATDQIGAVTLNGAAAAATIGQPGAIAQLRFTATAGQKVSVDIPSTTLPDACGVVWLRAPDGTNLASGCLIGGKGSIAATTLPVSGQYAVVVDPAAAITGTAQVKVHT